MTYEPPDCGALMARTPSECGALMAYQTRPECADLLQGTTQRTAPNPRLWKPGIDIAGMMAPGTIAIPRKYTATRQPWAPRVRVDSPRVKQWFYPCLMAPS
jgi:hypothetical protein